MREWTSHGRLPERNYEISPQSPIGQDGEDIVGSKHSDYLPGQRAIDPIQVDRYSDALRAGQRPKPIEFVTVPHSSGEARIIADGNTRYVAGKRTGLTVEIIEGSQDPLFFVDEEEDPPSDWSETFYEPWQPDPLSGDTEDPDELQLVL